MCGKVFLKSFCCTVFVQFNHRLSHSKLYPILPFTLVLLTLWFNSRSRPTYFHLRGVYDEKDPQHAYLDQNYLSTVYLGSIGLKLTFVVST